MSSRQQTLSTAALTLAVVFGGSSCAEVEGERPLNVLMVVIDTARADKLGCYGHPGGLTPSIDALAAQGARFEEASAHAPWTLPSTASLLTSLHPEEHGAGGYLDLAPLASGGSPRIAFRGLAQEVETVAEAFSANGWATAAVVNVDFLDRTFGLTQGFETVDAKWFESNSEVRSASETTDAALAWLERREDRPFFLMTHYFDPHATYTPPAEYRARFAAPRDRTNESFVFGTRSHMLMLRAGKLELDAQILERAERLYEAELAYVDAEIGRLLAGLEAAGLAGDTVVVLTADHGEEFLDHGGFEHGHTLYEELTRVPLVWRLPGRFPAASVPLGGAALIDVAPTLCDLAGIDTPSSFSGRSLVPALEGASTGERQILAHGNFWGAPLTSWRSGGWKLILTPQTDGTTRVELFDLVNDPGETHDLSAAEPERVAQLRAECQALVEHMQARKSGEPIELSEAERARLEALGYLGAGESEDGQ